MLDPIHFFIVLAILQAVDAWTTYQATKISKDAKESNPILRGLFKKFGVKETLLVVKIGLLAYVWFNPIVDLQSQIMLIVLYVAVAVNNLVVLKKVKKK